jgi:hypothetical protein
MARETPATGEVLVAQVPGGAVEGTRADMSPPGKISSSRRALAP